MIKNILLGIIYFFFVYVQKGFSVQTSNGKRKTCVTLSTLRISIHYQAYSIIEIVRCIKNIKHDFNVLRFIRTWLLVFNNVLSYTHISTYLNINFVKKEYIYEIDFDFACYIVS